MKPQKDFTYGTVQDSGSISILEARGIAVVVANAADVKHVPGRKTNVNDAQWLQQLHA